MIVILVAVSGIGVALFEIKVDLSVQISQEEEEKLTQ